MQTYQQSFVHMFKQRDKRIDEFTNVQTEIEVKIGV